MEQKYNADNTKILQLFWGNGMPPELLNFIKKYENLFKINYFNLKFNVCKSIVSDFMRGNFYLLKLNFLKEYVIIQIICSNIFPNYKIGIQHKIIYDIKINNWLTSSSRDK